MPDHRPTTALPPAVRKLIRAADVPRVFAAAGGDEGAR